MAPITDTVAVAPPANRTGAHPAWVGLRRLLAHPAGLVAFIVVLGLVACALFAPWIAPYDPVKIAPRIRFQGPSWEHWLGTDQLGRDVLSRVIYGTGVALKVALSGTLAALLIGATLGIVGGLSRGSVDGALLLLCDAMRSLPLILFALAIVAIYGPSLATLIAIIAFSMAPGYFRVVRNQVLVLRSMDFVAASQSMGASLPRIALTHLVPNLLGPIIVLIAMDIPAVIGIESGLSFLGQGIQPPDPSWGSMLSDGYSFIRQAPHLAIAAGLPVIVSTVAFTFLGEALRDVLDPKSSRGRG
ncbi:ABC transporter permease [Ancylobacter defluvii]|uniref:Peptide ABC transporter permease n=1 Tax=Ancylobacter defluvii TaxID=1282440 RepID=A0A9W6JRY6_9HYPH|nr:ABC transporter permease [Ancylobacter defluvii]MBS7590071.1 ABC transporter permease [Ancylobacter defluvii]GLK82681.1 peptide ABC transporter permease [Ancylobacter defluvii]